MKRTKLAPYWKLTLCYLAFGMIWIFVSDSLSFDVIENHALLATIQIMQGWVFVSLSTLFIFHLSRKAFQQQAAVARQRLHAHRHTIEGVHHILFNYMNQMQLLALEAERFEDFDPELLETYSRTSRAAIEELTKLGELEDLSPESIDSFVYRNLQNKNNPAAPG